MPVIIHPQQTAGKAYTYIGYSKILNKWLMRSFSMENITFAFEINLALVSQKYKCV